MSAFLRLLRVPLHLVAVVVLLGLALFPQPVSAAPVVEVVASGLDNPRGLAFGPNGALFVAEAGKGGSGPCIIGGEGGEVCYGATGAVTRIWKGKQQRLLTGLPSLASADGSAATGAHDVSFTGMGEGYVVIGLGADPGRRTELGDAGMQFGTLMRFQGGGFARIFGDEPALDANPATDGKRFGSRPVDIAGYEAAANPDGGAIDSNPYAVLALPGRQVVADAGGNSLLNVDARGRISTLAVFPDRLVDAPPFLGLPAGAQIPMQSVPNAVALGPGGALFVGELTGFPFPVGGANVYRVKPGSQPTVYASGFTNIIDLAFDKAGNLYVLEISSTGLLAGVAGALIKVAPNGTKTTVLDSGLVAPAGLAIGPDGAIYISNFGIMAGAGQVLRVTP